MIVNELKKNTNDYYLPLGPQRLASPGSGCLAAIRSVHHAQRDTRPIGHQGDTRCRDLGSQQSRRQNDVHLAARKSFSIGLIGLLMGDVAIGPRLLCLLLSYTFTNRKTCMPLSQNGECSSGNAPTCLTAGRGFESPCVRYFLAKKREAEGCRISWTVWATLPHLFAATSSG